MQIQYTKNLNPGRFEFVTKFGLLFNFPQVGLKITAEYPATSRTSPEKASHTDTLIPNGQVHLFFLELVSIFLCGYADTQWASPSLSLGLVSMFLSRYEDTHWFRPRATAMLSSSLDLVKSVLLLLLRIRSAHLEILGFPIANAY